MEVLKKIKKGKYSFTPEELWSGISEDAKDLVLHMIVVEPQKRFSADEAMKHKWIDDFAQKETPLQSELSSQIVTKLRSFLAQNRLKKVAMQIIAQHLGDDEISVLKDHFLTLDKE